MVAKKEKFGTSKVVIISVAAVLVVALLLAAVVVNGVAQIAQTFIRSNPETIDVIAMIDAASASYDSDSDLILSLLWAKYASGSVGGKVEGSFTGRFTTEKVRSLEKVNLSCIDKYSYDILDEGDVFALSTEVLRNRMRDKGCVNIYGLNNKILWKCPLRNCDMREVVSEVAGEFIPERIDIRKVEAESTLNEVKKE